MQQILQRENPKKRFNKIIFNTSNKALYNQTNKELFYYPIQNLEKSSEIDKNIYDEAEKILTNLDTIYFDLDKEEKKLYKRLEKIIINYTLQK
ncbi:hypothetical protein HDR59_04335 [bacterium]|nr:hypothetical protein [bacterium]